MRAICLCMISDYIIANEKKLVLQGIPDQWEYRKTIKDTEIETLLSVFTTWELSFEQIGGSNEIKNKKEHFLTLAALFNNESISHRYFEAYCRSKEDE